MNTTEGAREFVKYYVDQVGIAYMTPRAGLLPPLSAPACRTCGGFEAQVVRFTANGQRYDQAPLNVLEIAVDPDDQLAKGFRLIDVTAHQNAVHIVDSANAVVEDVVADDVVFVFEVVRATDNWAVSEIRISG